MTRTRFCSKLFLLLLSLASNSAPVVAADSLAEADRLRLTGRYAEAQDMYQRLGKEQLERATLGRAACLVAVGKEADADKMLAAAAEQSPKSAAFPAERASLAFQRGDYEAAQRLANDALQLNGKQLRARWVNAELHRVAGRLDEARRAYDGIVEFYNQTKNLSDPESLHVVGMAAAQAARWNRKSEQFSFLVNDLYPSALAYDKNFWPAYLEAALLFAEKYNTGDATNELNAALAINPNAAEIHAVRAALALQAFDFDGAKVALDRALAINPRSLVAHQVKAEMLLTDTRPIEAITVLQATLQLNPKDDETLGRLASVYGALDGIPAENSSTRMGKIVDEVVQRNAKCGEFFAAIAGGFERLRRYPQAAKYYEEAQRRMPQLIHIPGELGMLQMRLGNEVEGSKLLTQAFEFDPFNVRVKNMLEVLDVLHDYAVLETDHFVIRFDRGHDELLAKFAAKYLEDEVYPEITQKLGYKPSEKSLFEIFNRAKNTKGHGWFSARMVGLPFIGTVGACAGKMVAIASPNDLPKKYDWARVLRHEFVHVVNLQQTDFNIPHWFTEALAVSNEASARPPEWNKLLARRLRAKEVFNLDTINHGFARPKSGDDWTLAYCQAALYADYMLANYGPDATTKMLAAYADHLTTPDAIKRCFGVEKEIFEKGYRLFLEKEVEGITSEPVAGEAKIADLEKAAQADPENPEPLARLAYAYIQSKDNQKARRYADESRKLDGKNQLAAYVLARLRLSIGDNEEALKLLEDTLNRDQPQEQALLLLAALKQKSGELEIATTYFELGAAKFSHTDRWLKALVRIYLDSEDTLRLREILTKLVILDAENSTYIKKLAQLAIVDKDWPAATEWGKRAVHLDINDADAHASLGLALAEQKRHAAACDHYEAALRLEPRQADWQLGLAKSLLDLKKKDEARRILDEVLSRDGDNAEAKELLEKHFP